MFSQGVLDLIYSPQSSPLNLFTYTQWACEHLPRQCEYMFYLPLILFNSAMQDINALGEQCRLMIACCTTGFSQCLSGIVNASLEFRKSASIKSFTWTGAEILIHTWICVCVYRRTAGTIVFCAVEKPFLLEQNDITGNHYTNNKAAFWSICWADCSLLRAQQSF